MKPSAFILLILPALLFAAKMQAQATAVTPESKNILFVQPLGYCWGDFSLGYERRLQRSRSFTLIVDAYISTVNEKKINDTPTEYKLYNGITVRPGIKFRRESGWYTAIEGYYKYSGYDNKLILRENHEGEAYDVYYLETRWCNSLGADYKFGYELRSNSLFFSPFILAGLRLRIDDLTILGKYGYDGVIGSGTIQSITVRPIPIIRIGFLLGLKFQGSGQSSPVDYNPY